MILINPNDNERAYCIVIKLDNPLQADHQICANLKERSLMQVLSQQWTSQRSCHTCVLLGTWFQSWSKVWPENDFAA